MAAPRRSLSLRNTGSPLVAAARPSPSPGPRGTSEPEFDSDSQLDGDTEELERSSCLSVSSDEEQGASAPWPSEPGERSAPAALLERCVAAGAVSQETLDLICRRTLPCFAKFSEMEEMVNMEAEINEIKLKTEMMQLENETADITHHFYLGKKCEILQDMKRHLEAVLKEKRHLRKRLIKHRCQESLPIEATYHKSIVELLAEAVTFIEKLESHLQSVRSIPQIPHMMSNMDTTLSKTEVLMIELAELREQILKWEELQKEVYSNNVCNTADLDFGLSLT
ncbi:HAUS augmin-like complex subunit 2 isoform X2 [Onychostruthus taczanowskii]|uniref:HAUS augmin-like complex subunit 2 isoform X2 n=1 Tax=Onychostruthus taczanowskii TaxID=356909 RepID=UPI001B804E9C|nr:HAUS augmin-like complex subunit 2 isoform X2 [Onychostruthus taczanowskii]